MFVILTELYPPPLELHLYLFWGNIFSLKESFEEYAVADLWRVGGQ